MFLDRPLFGCGYGQYQTESLNYLSDRTSDLNLERSRGFSPPQCVPVAAGRNGAGGAGVVRHAAELLARDAWRLWRDAALPLWVRQQGLLLLAVLGAYVVNGMFHDVSVVPLANMTLFFLAGITAGLRATAIPIPSTQVAAATLDS